MFLLKLGNIRLIFSSFKTVRVAKNISIASMHFARKCARIFVLGHKLFLKDRSFPQAAFSENGSLLGTDNVRGKISEHSFA